MHGPPHIGGRKKNREIAENLAGRIGFGKKISPFYSCVSPVPAR